MKDPATIVDRKGRPKRRKGCFWRALRYLAARELGSVAEKDLDVKGPGMVAVGRGVCPAVMPRWALNGCLKVEIYVVCEFIQLVA